MQDFHLPEQTFSKIFEGCSLYLKFVNLCVVRKDWLYFQRLFFTSTKIR